MKYEKTRIRNIVGPPVSGDDFFPRNEALQDIANRLQYNSIILSGTRRVGKTSLVQELCRQWPDRCAAPNADCAAISLDVSGCRSARDFVQELYAAALIHKTLGSRLLSALQTHPAIVGQNLLSIRSTAVGIAADKWQESATVLMEELAGSSSNLLIAVDEFQEIFKDMEGKDINALLNWVGWVNQSFSSINFILYGSVNLERFLRQKLLDADMLLVGMNAFKRVELGPLNKVDAENILKILEDQGGQRPIIADEAMARVFYYIGNNPIPFYLQLFFRALMDLVNKRPAGKQHAPVNLEEVDQTYQQILKHQHYLEIAAWQERLVPELGDKKGKAATAILSYIAAELFETGFSLEQLEAVCKPSLQGEEMQSLLEFLEMFLYLQKTKADASDSPQWSFRYRLIHGYWQKFFPDNQVV